MSVAFTKAPTIAPGDAITNTQLATLAKAFNDRLRSGLGDGTWRIHFLLLSLFRGIRNRADEFTFASELEYFWYYQNVDPINPWPDAPAGGPTGINVTNLLGAHVFGNNSAGIFSEATHVNPIVLDAGTVGMSPLNGWELAKAQRGAVDPRTGGYDAPMRALAVRTNIGVRPPSKGGLSYGSWLKLPDQDDAGLFKPESKMLKRALNAFAREFRGSDGQRGPDDYHLQEAFDCQRFFEMQYHLSPNYGTDIGPDPVTEEPRITANYPKFTISGPAGGGPVFVDEFGNTPRLWHPGFVLDGWKVQVTGATAPVSFNIEVGGEPLVEVNLTPDAGGFASEVVLLPVALLSTSEQPMAVSCHLVQPLPTGSIEIEFTELQAWVPEIPDLYALLRVSACDEANLPDGAGTLEDQARIISDEYFRVGCAVNPHPNAGMPEEDTVINRNAVYEAARRMSQAIAITRRHEFVDYSVEDGKSVLWFRREFGIGEGVKVKPLEGLLNIKHAAEERGLTNEWLLDIELRPYGEDESDLFKTDSYTDIFSLVTRCHFNSQDIRREPALLEHISYGISIQSSHTVDALVPEAPPGWAYTVIQGIAGATNANTISCPEEDEACKEYRRNFYKSCRLYEPPVEIESVEIEGTAPDELLKITLTGRLHHCDTAPASIPRSRSSWDVNALRAEPYRTAENGLREYLVQYLDGGQQCVKTSAGNYSTSNTYTGTDPWGSCYPVFKWTQLIPFAYDDGNNSQDSVDTHFRHDPFLQMELFLRAMAEGYVDGSLSAENACRTEGAVLYDYRFEDLCLEAFGNSRIAVLPDYPDGYGPLPNTSALAAVYNQFAAAVNLLTRVRVMLPSILECNNASEDQLSGVDLMNGLSEPESCGQLNDAWGQVEARSPGTPSLDDTWFSCGGSISASYQVRLTGECAGGPWELAETTTVAAYRFALSDGDSIFAIPEHWRDMWDTSQEILGKVTTTLSTTTHSITPDPALATKCTKPGGPAFAPAFPTTPEGGPYMLFTAEVEKTEDPCAFLPGSKTIKPGGTGPTEVFITRDNEGKTCDVGGALYDISVSLYTGQIPVLAIPLV